ncbi:MAG: hypothetical protein QGG09_18990 [Pirellulaceae bacterium]|nr:hypothetical protein [Pirellulaceae bacterium]HJN08653.1 hypothetical protein [Pirellulaceae bacterium]
MGNVWAWGAIGLAVAASFAIAVVWWPQLGEIPGPSPAQPIVDRPPQGASEMQPPTMLAYQHALGQSPDDLDELLDRHAASLLIAGSSSNDIGSLYQDLMLN